MSHTHLQREIWWTTRTRIHTEQRNHQHTIKKDVEHSQEVRKCSKWLHPSKPPPQQVLNQSSGGGIILWLLIWLKNSSSDSDQATQLTVFFFFFGFSIYCSFSRIKLFDLISNYCVVEINAIAGPKKSPTWEQLYAIQLQKFARIEQLLYIQADTRDCERMESKLSPPSESSALSAMYNHITEGWDFRPLKAKYIYESLL